MCWCSEPVCHNIAIHLQLRAPIDGLASVQRERMCREERWRRKKRLKLSEESAEGYQVEQQDHYRVPRSSPRRGRQQPCSGNFAEYNEALEIAGSPLFIYRDVPTVICSNRFWCGKSGRNFYTVKSKEYRNVSFIIFPYSGNVIVTGIRDEKGIHDVLLNAAELFGYRTLTEMCRSTPTVINSTWCGEVVCYFYSIPAGKTRLGWNNKLLPKKYVMSVISRYSHANMNNADLVCNPRSSFFPGVKLRHQKLRGTINLFNSGKYVLVGVRNKREASKLHAWLSAIMKKFWTTNIREIPCAFPAAKYCHLSLADVEEDLEGSGTEEGGNVGA